MKLQPVGDNILIEPLKVEDKSPGGIFIPDVAKRESQRGKVVAVGSGKILEDGTRREILVKEGDIVLFTSYGKCEVEADGKKYLIMDVLDLLAIVKE